MHTSAKVLVPAVKSKQQLTCSAEITVFQVSADLDSPKNKGTWSFSSHPGGMSGLWPITASNCWCVTVITPEAVVAAWYVLPWASHSQEAYVNVGVFTMQCSQTLAGLLDVFCSSSSGTAHPDFCKPTPPWLKGLKQSPSSPLKWLGSVLQRQLQSNHHLQYMLRFTKLQCFVMPSSCR